MEEENKYREGYFIYSLTENVYIKCLSWRDIANKCHDFC